MNAPDHFGLFGLPERFEIDLADLEKRYLALSRELHPDRHATGSASERLAAVQKTTDLNQAYKVLRDDFRRSEHLLHRRGIETTEAESQDRRATVESRLLVEVLELREALEDARDTDHARVAHLKTDVEGRVRSAWSSIREGWKKVEAGDEDSLRAIVADLTALRYYRRFLDEVEQTGEG
jgi:molecular chaperone HscB